MSLADVEDVPSVAENDENQHEHGPECPVDVRLVDRLPARRAEYVLQPPAPVSFAQAVGSILAHCLSGQRRVTENGRARSASAARSCRSTLWLVGELFGRA
ncbi:hypothetical protein ACTG9Q_31545 [Actinokineospora sp. 24-640]